MSRMLVVSNLFLVLVACVLAWRLYGEPARLVGAASCAIAPHAPVRVPMSRDADALEGVSVRLDRIDGRLDALVRAYPGAVGPAAARAVADTPPPMSAAEADRRLAGMLPGPTVDHEAMARYRAQLAMLPDADQAAIEAALSRAINQDRLRLRLQPGAP